MLGRVKRIRPVSCPRCRLGHGLGPRVLASGCCAIVASCAKTHGNDPGVAVSSYKSLDGGLTHLVLLVVKVVALSSQTLIEFQRGALQFEGEKMVTTQNREQCCCPRICGCRRPQTRAQQLHGRVSTLPTHAVVQMDRMDAAVVNDDEIVPGCGLRQGEDGTVRPMPVTQLDTQSEIFQCYALETESRPPLFDACEQAQRDSKNQNLRGSCGREVVGEPQRCNSDRAVLCRRDSYGTDARPWLWNIEDTVRTQQSRRGPRAATSRRGRSPDGPAPIDAAGHPIRYVKISG